MAGRHLWRCSTSTRRQKEYRHSREGGDPSACRGALGCPPVPSAGLTPDLGAGMTVRIAAWRSQLATSCRKLLRSVALTALVGLLSAAAVAQDVPQSLKWADLLPAATAPAAPKSFLANRPKTGAPDHTVIPEGRWLSPGAGPQASAGPPAVVETLDGKRVKLGGYVVPLDFDATKVKEFLLVPFVGACIHVPPPPANQLVYVRSEQGFDVKGSFDPVWVTGKMQTKVAFTGLAEAGYSLEAEKVEARAE